MNRRAGRTRCGRAAFAACLLLAAPSSAETRCAAPPDSAAALAATDGRTRLEWIDQRLQREAHRMRWWNYGWATGIGAAGLGTLVPVPFVASSDRVDYYTGAVLAAAGVAPFLLAPPNVLKDSPALHGRLIADPLGSDAAVCALLADAEADLVRDARNERLLNGWWSHAANVAINGGGFLFLGLVYHHWFTGMLNGVSGVAVGEAVILTQPTRSISDLAAYQRGDLGP